MSLLRTCHVILLCCLLLSLLSAGPAQAVPRAFTERYSINTTGDIHLIGNTAMTCDNVAPAVNAAACVNGRAGTGTLNNNDFSMVFVNEAGTLFRAGTTTYPTSAVLSMPAGSTVLWAGLYWGAESSNAGRNTVTFQTPTSGATTVSASQVDFFNAVGCANACDRYSAFAEVTNLVNAGGNGTYRVSNIQAWLDTASAGSTYAGWALVVAFENGSLPLRNLTVFDGYDTIGCTGPNNVNITVSGFLTPYSGPVNTTMGAITGEGDLGSVGDNFRLNGVNLVDPVRVANNFFNTSISNLGARVTSTSPNYYNQLGWDVARVNASNILANGSTSATMTLNTAAECYYPSTVTFATDLYMPVVTPNVVKTGVDVNGGNLVPGDTLRYTISMTNTGYDPAKNLTLNDPIPPYTSYVPGSLRILTGANPGAMTDASGDDQAEYVGASNEVVFRLGAGADGSQGGTLAFGEGTSLSFDVQLASNIPTGTILSNTAELSYNGQTLGTVFDAASSAATSAVFTPPTATKAFSPNPVDVSGVATLSIVLTNPASNLGTVTGVAFTDTYPAGMVNATPNPNPTVSCTPGSTTGTLTGGVAGGNSIGLTGATITQNGVCTVTVRVTSATQGNYVNNLGTITTTNAGNTTGIPASATFSVGQPTIAKSFGAASIVAGNSTNATFILTNPTAVNLPGATFTDNMPANLVVAAGATANSCGGTLTATPGTGTISLSGGSIPAVGSCTITVPVTSGTVGSYDNTTTGVTTALTPLGPPSNTATLRVYTPLTAVKSFTPTSISPGGTSQLIITVSNPNPSGMPPVTGVAFTDSYPNPPNLVNTATPNPVVTCTAGSSASLAAGTGTAGGTTIGITGGALAAGGSCTVTVSVTSTVAANYNNSTGSITSTNAGTGNAASASLNVSSLTPPATAKSFSPTPIARGQASTLTITLTNSNASAITGVAFTDSYPPGLVNTATPNGTTTCGAGTVIASADGASVSLSGGTIPASGSCTVTVNVTSATADTYYNNTGLIATTNAGTGLGANASLTVLAPPQITKSFTPNPVAPGAVSVLTLTLTNPVENPVDLTGVAVTDTYPAGLLNTATPNPVTTCAGGTASATANGNALTLSGASIPANGSCTVTVNVAAAAAGNQVNTTGAVTATNAGTGNAATATLAVGSPGISKTFGTSPILVGGTSRLTITMTNPTGSPMTAATFTDNYPAGMTNTGTPATATTCGGTVTAANNGPSVSLSGGSIPAGGSCTVSVNVTATTNATNTIAAGALTVSGGGSNGSPASATLTVTPPPQASKSFAPTSIPTGGTSVLTINITNPTSNTVNGVTFTDTYPAGLVNTAAATPSLTCTAGSSGTRTGGANGGNTIGMNTGVLLGNGSCTLTVNVTSASANSYNNTTGNITSTNGGTGSAATAVLTVLTPFTGAKTFSPATVNPTPDISTLTVTLTNPNATPITDVAFTDTYPGGLTNDATPSPSTSCGGTVTAAAGGNSLALSGATIPASGSCTVNVTVTSTAGNKTNPAFTVTSSNDGSATVAAATLTVRNLLAPGVTKSFSPNQVVTGANSTLTITLSNPNGVRMDGIAFTDTYPAGMVNTSVAADNCANANAVAAIGGNTLSINNARINAGTNCTITVSVSSATPGNYSNSTGLVTSTNAATGGPATDTLTVVLLAPTVTKAFTPTEIEINNDATMTITIANPNAADLTSVSFTDSYPAGLVNAAIPNATTTCGGTATADPGGTSLVLTGGTVPAGGSCNASVKVTGGTGSYLNDTGAIYSGNAPNSASATAILVIYGLPQVTVVKSSANVGPTGYAVPGETVRYTLVFTNSDTRVLDNNSLVLVDMVPANTALLTVAPVVTVSNVPAVTGLTLTYGGLTDAGDQVEFSTDGSNFGYQPVDSGGIDPNVSHIRFRPAGSMNGGGASFTVTFKVRLD